MRMHESALGLPVLMSRCFISQNFLVYMFFLLVVLLLNYSDSGKDTHSWRLRTQLLRVLHTPDCHSVSRLAPAHTLHPSRTRAGKVTFILQVSHLSIFSQELR